MITIFTPAYNRVHTLPRLYDSLRRLNNRDFEWLVIDDGSSDGTEELVKSYAEKEFLFPIRYYRTDNGGKPRAINLAAGLAKGDVFFIVDSDDWLPEDSLDIILHYFSQIRDDDSFVGIGGARLLNGKISGGRLASEYIDAINSERLKYGIDGERAEVFKTEVLKRYPFPEFEGENFIPEAACWDKMGYDGLKIRWIDRVIYSMEYQDTGLTKNLEKNYRKNPQNYLFYIAQILKNPIHPLWRKMIYRGKCISLIKHSLIPKEKIRTELNVGVIGYYVSVLFFRIHRFLRGGAQ